MALQQELRADPGPWEGRSHDQLKEVIDRGLLGGDEFILAAREMERRSREVVDAEDRARADSAHASHILRLKVGVGIWLATVLAIAVWLFLD